MVRTLLLTPQQTYEEDGELKIEQLLRRTFDTVKGRKGRARPLIEPLDISSVAGENVVVTHLGIYPAGVPHPRFYHSFCFNPVEMPFRAALFIRDVRDSYMDPEDMSFKLKGVVFYPRVWEYLVRSVTAFAPLPKEAGILA